MHDAVMAYVGRFATEDTLAVLDIGGRNLNGSTRRLFLGADPYRVLDIRPGVGVDIVADAATWEPDQVYDLVLCTEVFEHTPEYPAICATVHRALRPGGRFVVTCAGPGRSAHSGIEATALQPGEYYQNVSPADLLMAMRAAGFENVEVNQVGYDLQATGVRP